MPKAIHPPLIAAGQGRSNSEPYLTASAWWYVVKIAVLVIAAWYLATWLNHWTLLIQVGYALAFVTCTVSLGWCWGVRSARTRRMRKLESEYVTSEAEAVAIERMLNEAEAKAQA